MTCQPYPVDPAADACCGDWDLTAVEVQNRALAFAWASMRYLTAGRLGYCETMVRPCLARCAVLAPGFGGMWPILQDGEWLNSCGCIMPTECGCEALSEIKLPGEVAEITEVALDGAAFISWRLDNHRVLVRTDGEPWPDCQDLRADADQPGTFAVSYVPGVQPGSAGLAAVGALACEFTKACTGTGKCRLPSAVTSVARQGVSMSFSEGMFPGGLTGIREVDAYILSVNPYALKVPPRVWSPDIAQSRFPG